jgi:two-component system, OmpR family, response regulator
MTRRILVVDDEQSIREALSKLLHAEGYEIALAENGQEAIEKLIQQPFDLLVLDIGLPVHDGWATLRWLAEFNPLFPVIVITGLWKQSQKAEAAGVDVLIEKPLDVPKLLQNIRELLQEPPESRVRRIHNRERGLRHVTCDVKEFCQQLLKRFTTPDPSNQTSGPKNQQA